MANHTYTAYANKSCVLKAANPDTNYSSGSSLVLSGADGAGREKALLGFDTSGWSADFAGQIIQSIKLYIYLTAKSISGGTLAYLQSYYLDEVFTEGTATWNNSSLKYVLSPELDLAAYSGFPAVNNYIELEARGLSRYIIDYGVELTPKAYDSSYMVITFNSSRAASNKPYIQVVTADSVPVTAPVSPVNSFAVSNEATTFTWSYANDNGDTQSAYVLQYSTDGETWLPLASASSSELSCEIAADTLPAGTIYWRVKVTSQYSIDSAYSEAAAVVVIGAPAAPVVTATTTPRPLVSWQSSGQQAFQVMAGTYDSGTQYGTAKSFKIPLFLDDDDIDVAVRIQNSYGLWSAWATIGVTIANTPEDAVTLAVAATHKATLSWNDVSPLYYVYRDGIPIAKTTEPEYADEFVIGSHTYRVRAVDGDNYSLSNTEEAVMQCTAPMITAIDAISWISLRLSAAPVRILSINGSQTVVYQHYSGRVLPIAETSGFQDFTYSFEAAFRDSADAMAFEAILGKTVCYKDPRGRLCVGMLGIIDISVSKFYTGYKCVIQQTDYVEEVEYE